MANEAELKIKSDSIVKTTSALEDLIGNLEKLAKQQGQNDNSNDENAKSQKKIQNALKQSDIARAKAVELMKLEQKGLDKTSDEYARLKGAILGKEIAAKKGFTAGTIEYKQLIKTTKVREQATAALKRNTKQHILNNKKTVDASSLTGKFTAKLDGMTKQVQLVDGPLGGIASRMTALSSIMKSGVGAVAGITVGIGLFVREWAKGVVISSQAEVQMKTMEAQVMATGYAAGFTAQQLDDMSRSLALSTLDNSKGVKEIITSMLQFKNVSGSAFRSAIELSEDMAIVMGTNAVSAAKTLGKVLENPIANYKQLKRSGIEFSKAEKDTMRLAQQKGDMYAAQEVILGKLEDRFKGVAKAQADTLSGDVDTFSQLWEEMWERMGKDATPALRTIVQFGNKWMEVSQAMNESDNETAFRKWKGAIIDSTGSLEESKDMLKTLKDEQSELAKSGANDVGMMSKSWLTLKATIGAVLPVVADMGFTPSSDDLTLQEQEIRLLEEKIKYTQEIVDVQAKKAPLDKKLTEQQEVYIEGLQSQVNNQRILTEVFQKTGDTRSQAYRDEKAQIDASNAAKKVGLEVDLEQIEVIAKNMKALSDLTETRIRLNTVIQKEKSLKGKQRALQTEIELYELTTQGIARNSAEYLKAVAVKNASNQALQAGFEIGSKEHKRIEDQTVALVKLQVEMNKVNALKANDSNSSQYVKLEKEIELYKLSTSGVAKNSAEYHKAAAAITARNQATAAGFEVGSKEHAQIEEQILALNDLEQKMRDVANMSSLGMSQGIDGSIIVEGTKAALEASSGELGGKLMELLVSGQIPQELFDSKSEEIKEGLLANINEITMPLGIVIDAEGNEELLSSVEAVMIEKDLKMKELDDLRRDGFLTDESIYLERRNEIEAEFDQKANERRIAVYRASAEHLKLVRAKDTADSISNGLQNLAAVAGNNKKLQKLAKMAAIFSASVSLVDGLSEANKLPYPANIPAYAKAFVQGTQLVQMAGSLKEPSYAFGGVDIDGEGTGRSDSIKANIARGESVMTQPATSRYKETLKRMNAGLPIGNAGGGQSLTVAPSITIQGDASENTVRLIQESLSSFEDRVAAIAQGVSMQTIQEESEVGGLLDPI